MEEWLHLHSGGCGEIEEKKSRFIATIEPIANESEAAEFVARIKKQYWDARHNCSAFVLGDDGRINRCSDDGEPSGTAGRPMLEVLLNEHITNVAVVVTRYFGGTLLGTGGLVRAYQSAVKAGLENCVILRTYKGILLKVTCDYTDWGKLQFMFNQEQVRVLDTEYAAEVEASVLIEDDRLERISDSIRDVTKARAKLELQENVLFSLVNEDVVIKERSPYVRE